MKKVVTGPESSADAAGGPGLRHLNKQDKLKRIKAAASELFDELGYDAATTRQIAARANVGLGTLFNYAKDKRDLFFLIYADELEGILHAAFTPSLKRRALWEQCISVFSALFRKFASNKELSRIVLRELTFYRETNGSDAFHPNRARVVEFVSAFIVAAQERGEVSKKLDAVVATEGLYYIYSGSVRAWVERDDTAIEKGLDRMTAQMAVYFAGLVTTEPARKFKRSLTDVASQ